MSTFISGLWSVSSSAGILLFFVFMLLLAHVPRWIRPLKSENLPWDHFFWPPTGNGYQIKNDSIYCKLKKKNVTKSNDVIFSNKPSKNLMIIDTDCGVDDALAILLAFSCSDAWDILAITCCKGNTSVDKVCENVMRLTNYCGCTEIPIYRGCDKPLLDVQEESRFCFHGEDGFGGVASRYSTGNQSVLSEHAASALVRLVKENKGQVTLVTLGPLTNVAIAKRLDNNFDLNLKDMLIMGGNIDGIGNVSVCGEFNFAMDPEAAYVVTNEFACPIKVFPWETCIRFHLSWDTFDEWTDKKHPVSAIIKEITFDSVSYVQVNKLLDGFFYADLLALATILRPSCIRKVETGCPVTVELSGSKTRGLMVVDRRFLGKRGKPKGQIEIITELNTDEVHKLLMEMVS